jgi:hypothetical protein
MPGTEEYRGYTLNVPGRRPPWGETENQAFKDIIDYLPEEGSYLTELHHHSNLYSPGTDTAAGQIRVSVTGTRVAINSQDDYEKIGATQTAVVINEAGRDVDFRVESDGDVNFLFGDASADRWGMGTGTPFLNVGTAAGDFAANNVGLHVYSATNNARIIAEGTIATFLGVDTNGAANDKMLELIVNAGVGRYLSLNDDLTTRTDDILAMDMGTGYVGMGIRAGDSRLHVHEATAGAVAAVANTVLTVENSVSAWISVLVPNGSGGGLVVGSLADNDAGQLQYITDAVVASGYWDIYAGAVNILNIGAGGLTIDDGGAANNTTSRLKVVQNNATGAVPVVELQQDDAGEGWIEFFGTVAADQSTDISTQNANGSHTAGNCSGPLENWQHYGMIRVTINGVGDRWIPLYTGS